MMNDRRSINNEKELATVRVKMVAKLEEIRR
jgi:hypothetical protein